MSSPFKLRVYLHYKWTQYALLRSMRVSLALTVEVGHLNTLNIWSGQKHVAGASHRFNFLSFGFWVFGSFGPAAQELLDRSCRRYRIHAHIAEWEVYARVHRHLSFAVMREVADQFEGRRLVGDSCYVVVMSASLPLGTMRFIVIHRFRTHQQSTSFWHRCAQHGVRVTTDRVYMQLLPDSFLKPILMDKGTSESIPSFFFLIYQLRSCVTCNIWHARYCFTHIHKPSKPSDKQLQPT